VFDASKIVAYLKLYKKQNDENDGKQR